MAQSVERHLGKVEVTGSIPVISSNSTISSAFLFYSLFIIKTIYVLLVQSCIHSIVNKPFSHHIIPALFDDNHYLEKI